MLQEYLAELSRVKTLTPEEERTYWDKFKKRQDVQARQRLIEAYQPLVYKVASNMNRNESMIYDLIQEGTIGLIEAVEGFNPEMEVLFSTYAVHRIKGRMLNYLVRNRSAKEVHGLLDDEEIQYLWDHLRDEKADIETEIANKTLHHRVDDAINRLSDREQQVIRDLFIHEKSPVQTAHELKISLSYLYKIQKKALQRLRGMLARCKIELKNDV